MYLNLEIIMSKNFIQEAISGSARTGILKTRRGNIQTPFFMSVATRAAIKAGVSMDDLEDIKAPVVLCNTYHLHLKPGEKLIEKAGGLHKFMKCDKPILTDSGGYQVFSIQGKKITDDGVFFNSHIDGKKFYMDAEISIDIQHKLGADMIMAFDECPPSRWKFTDEELKERYNQPDANEEDLKKIKQKQDKKFYFQVKKAVERTTAWAKRSLDFHFKKFSQDLLPTQRPQIFGIVQGGTFKDLREKSLKEITSLPFDGFAMGGLAVGEPPKEMYKVLSEIVGDLPTEKPRYLMGVGTPTDLIESVALGIDMFDCVLPARNARHGQIYTWEGELKISQKRYFDDFEVLDKNCGCPVCKKGFTRSYLNHLIKVGESLGQRYLTMHNLYFYHDLMRTMREKIELNEFENWKDKLLEKWGK